ncbi:MAG: hypothetical protein MPK62_10975, partial [Alphaproteobacteria bacterium]|nr:hypothetical protein [Alphaproteobacteria bacterium]
MKLGIFTTALAVVAAAAAVSGARGLPAASAEPLKVGFVYVGPVGDHGWACLLYPSDAARERPCGALGGVRIVQTINSHDSRTSPQHAS